MDSNKISVQEYLNDNSLLEAKYTPFDFKVEIVGKIFTELLKVLGGINTSMLRRISTEMFIETITNIDMNIEDENGLKGFDQLCYADELDDLKAVLGSEYLEFEKILSERFDDYIRMETNPALTISAIYKQLQEYAGIAMDTLGEKIKDMDVGELYKAISPYLPNGVGGDVGES